MPTNGKNLATVLLASAALGLAGRGLGRFVTEPPDPRRELVEHAEGLAKRLAQATAALPPSVEGRDRGFDVLSYDLSFRLDPAVRRLDGTTILRVSGVQEKTTTVTLDFDDAYAILSSERDGHALAPTSRVASKVTFTLDPPLLREERTTLTITYGGTPPGGGSLDFWSHATGLAATSLSEPFGARTMFPCVDDPADRARTTVHATVPPGYVAASDGVSSVTTGTDGWPTYTWTLPQPIPTYLVSLNVARYVEIRDTWVSAESGRSMPIQAFVLPESKALSEPRVATFRKHLDVLSSLFGEYPWIDSKYGIVESSFSGGMEHPTMTSIGTAQLGNPARDLTLLFVHELSHHWWGDHVTMRTWDDIWLNEGFATYSEVLYRERVDGVAPGDLLRTGYDDGRYSGALARQVVAPATNPFGSSAPVYQKGAWALHMLRRQVGDEAFFSGLRAYRERFALGNASRGDLRQLYEERTGLDLKAFFDQWVETPYRPILRGTYQSSLDRASVTVTVSQTQTHQVVHPEPKTGDVPWYRFPLLVRVIFSDGTMQDTPVVVDERTSTFTIPTPGRKPVFSLTLDPRNDLLKVVEATGPA